MSDFVEKISLNLDGTAVDGTAASGLEKTSAGAKGLLDDLKKLAAGTGADGALNGVTAAAAALGGAFGAIGGELIKSIAETSVKVAEGFASIVAETAKAAADVEKYTMQIASAYGGTNDWASSMERAARVIPGLQRGAIMTGASVEEMTKAFRSLSLLTDGTNAKVLAVTNSLTVMARTAGISADTLVSQIQRAALTGQMPLRGEAGRELALNLFPGLSPSEIGAQLKAAQEAGTLLDLLSSKMGDQDEKAKMLAGTWESLTGSWSKISASLKAEIGVAWDPLRVLFADLRDFAMGDEFRDMAKGIGEIGKGIVASEVRDWVLKWVAFKEMLRPLVEEMRPWVALLQMAYDVSHTDTTDLMKPLTRGIHPEKIQPVAEDPFAGAAASYRKFVDELSRKNDLAGLDGIEKQLAQIADTNDKDIQRVFEAWMKLDPATRKASDAVAAYAIVNDTAAKATSKAWEDVYAKQAAAAEKWGKESRAAMDKIFHDTEAANVKYDFDIASLRKKSSDDAVTLIQEQADFEIAAAGRVAADAMKQAEIRNTLDRDGAEIKNALIAKTSEIQEKAWLKEKTILDERSGSWEEYYKDLVAVAVTAGKGMAEAIQESLRTTADKAYANAVSIADGVNAALLKIRSELKTEGQIWSDYLTGIWGGITAGLDTALQHLESGTGSLKDAWRSMLDGMLKSLNTMVEEMVKKWLAGTKEMGGSGGLSSLFGGATQKAELDAQGNVVHGGTIDATTKGQGTQGVVQKKAPGTMSTGEVIGAAGLTALAGVAAISGADTVLGGGVAQAGIQLGALVATYVNVLVGVIIAAIGVIVQALMPRQSEFTARYTGGNMLRALTTGTAFGAAGSDTEKSTTAALSLSNSMTGFFADMFKDADPSVRLSILADLNAKMRAYFASLGNFGAHAGSGSDFQTDVSKIFTELLPKQIMHAMFGQTTNQLADPGGITGTGLAPGGKWGDFSSFSAADPKSPLVSFLTSMGFTIGKVNEIAGQIDVQSAADFQKYFSGLVGVVVSAQALSKKLSRTYTETVADAASEAAKTPAGKLADQAAAVTDLLKAVSFYTGSEQITKGQEAIAAAQQFYDNAKTAMLQLSAMATQTTKDVADETKKVLDSLKSPAELAAQSVADLSHDYDRMRFAANPEDLAAAWASAKSDFEAVAGELVNRIKQIRSLLDDIHTLQAAIANGPAPDAQSDPKAWLAQNMVDIGKYEAAMKAANPGSPEEIAAATTMAGLIRDRYQMELQLLDRIKTAIASVNQTIDDALFNLNVSEAKTPDDKASLIYGKIDALYGQLQVAKTPEEISSLVAQITGLTNQLLGLAPAGTAGHAEMVAYVRKILGEVRDTSTQKLGAQQTTAETDISTLGTKLAGAETRMSTALDHVQTDLDALVFHFHSAGDFMTGKLTDWGVEIQGQLAALDPVLTAMVTNFTDVNTALTGGTGTGPQTGPGKALPENLTDLGSGVNDARGALFDFTSTVRDATAALGGKAA